MLKIELQNLGALRQQLREFSDRRFRAAVSTALTRAAKEMSIDWQEQIDRRIDRPTPRTQAATSFTGATAATLQSRVFVKDQQPGTPAAEYLDPQERGGSRGMRKFEQALQATGAMPRGYVCVPGRGAKLDGYGNVARSTIISIITQLGAEYSPGYARVIPKTVAGRLRVMAKRGLSYIAVRPDEATAMRVSAGIYERSGDGALKAVFLFKRGVTYRKRLDLERTAATDGPKVVADEMATAIAQSFARLQAAR